MNNYFPALENQNGVNSSHQDSPEQPNQQQKIWEVANGPEQINEVSPEQEEAESTEIYNKQGMNTEQASNLNISGQKQRDSHAQRPEGEEQ